MNQLMNKSEGSTEAVVSAAGRVNLLHLGEENTDGLKSDDKREIGRKEIHYIGTKSQKKRLRFGGGRKLLASVTTPSFLPLSLLFSFSRSIFQRLWHNASASGDGSNTLL